MIAGEKFCPVFSLSSFLAFVYFFSVSLSLFYYLTKPETKLAAGISAGTYSGTSGANIRRREARSVVPLPCIISHGDNAR
jgi:hypothetical protein